MSHRRPTTIRTRPAPSELTRTDAPPRPTPGRRCVPRRCVVAGDRRCVVLDQLTKQWALSTLDDDHVIDVVWTLRFNLAFNTGMAFSQGTGLGPIIGVIALFVVVALLVSIGRATSRIYPFAVGLIVGGAIGNLPRPPVPRAGLAARRRGRLHRRAVVADLQRRRHRRHRGRHPARPEHACSPARPAPPHVISERVPAALAGERIDRDRRPARRHQPLGGRGRRDRRRRARRRQRSPRPARSASTRARWSRSIRRRSRGRRSPGPSRTSTCAVVHDDDAVIVVDKPAGLVVHPGAGNPTGTLVNGLLARFPELAGVGEPSRPGIVHRLDAGSSGLLVVARTDDAAADLIRQFAAHTAGRRYDAVVWGHPDAPHGIVDAPIGRDPADPLEDGGDRRRPAGAHRVRGRRPLRRPRPRSPACRAGWRPGGRTRSGSTSPPSATRSSATPPTASAARRSASSGRSCTPPSCPSTTRSPASA